MYTKMSYQLAFASFLLAGCQELANLPSQASETDPAAQSSTTPTSNEDTDVTKDSGNEPKVETSSMPDMPDIPGMAIPSTGTPTGDLVANGGHTQTGTGTSSGSGSGTGSGSIDSGLGEPATLSSPSVLTTSPNDDATVNIQFTLSRESGVTLYSNDSCSGSTLGSATKPSGTVTMTTTNVPTNATTTIYAKPDGSATCTQVGTYTHDNIDPTISSHSITTSSPGSTLTPTATFTLSETAVITLYTNNSCTTAISSATQKPSGVQTQDSNAISANSTVQFFMQAVDLAGNASLCMALGSYTHDNQLPSITNATITTTSPSASDLTPDVSFSLNKAATVSLYSDSSCSTSISSSISKSSGSNTMTTDSLTANATVTIYGRAVDSQSNQSSCVSFGTYVHDNQSPSLSSVSVSTSSPGTSQTPTAAFTLSENATVTLYSDSGCTSSISSATSKNIGSQTLNTNSITANSTVTIFAKAVDAASNASSCTSIGSYTHDGTAPSLSSVSVTTSSPGTSLTADVQFTISETASVTLYSNDSCSSAISSAASKTGAAQTMSTNNLTANTATTIYAKAVDAATNASSCTSIGSYTPDTTAPTAGSAVEFSNVTSSSVTVKWGVASDSVTAASGLSYKLVVAATTGAIDDASEINSASGASVIVDWTVGSSLTWSANKTSANASSMTMYTAYYFAVAVKDAAGRISVYSPQGVTTSCGCSAGQYASGGSCVTAETGYYAASCERTACSNKPTNSGYLGTGYSTNTCEWACSNGYVANSTYTSCNTNNGYVPLSCGSNQLVTGFSGRAAGWIDKIGVRCRNFADGALIGSTIVGTEFGGEGGVSFISDCPNGSAVSEVDYYNHVGNGNNVAGRFRYRCKDLGSGTTSAWIPTSDTGEAISDVSGTLYFGASGSSGQGSVACSTPYYMNWQTISSAGEYAGTFSGSAGCRSIASTTNIVAQWQLDNNTTDSSPSGTNHGTLSGGATYSNSIKKYGTHALEFDGTDDHFDAGSSLLNSLSAFSVVGWVYVDDRPGSGQVSFWGQNDLMEMGFNNSGLSRDVCVWVNGGSEQCSSSELALDTWYQIVITMSQTNGTRLYVNGSQVANTSISTVGSTSGYTFKIGAGVWGASGANLDGFVDDVMIYSRELSSTEVAQLYGN